MPNGMRSRFGKAAPESKPSVPEETAPVVLAPSQGGGAAEARPGPSFLLDLLGPSASADQPPRCRVEVEHHTVLNWGARHDNEDRVMYHKDELPDARLEFHTIGVLDGHDTEAASDFVSKRLPAEVGRWLKEGSSVVEGYTKAMEVLEDDLRKETATAGSCVLSCTVAGSFVWCANLGDCRAVLVRLAMPEAAQASGAPGGAAPWVKPKVNGITWLSTDHKASSSSERLRIQRAGGRVCDGRVEGLEPSRTLGDFDVKDSTQKGVISIEPEVRRYELMPTDPSVAAQAVLVCATDGVWDVMTGQDLCNLIVARRDICKLQTAMAAGLEGPDSSVLKALAEDLVQFSVAKGSRDDCTAIVALISAPPYLQGAAAESGRPRPHGRA